MRAGKMGIFQRFEDEVPSIFVASFVGFLTFIVVLPLTLYVFSLFEVRDPFIAWGLVLAITVSATGGSVAMTLGKLRKP